ncbi:MAG: LCP family protein [Candidatus Saccharibacteria bacterium]|nr:LCP family protein [Candidatus Saccharibacteria bacterium]
MVKRVQSIDGFVTKPTSRTDLTASTKRKPVVNPNAYDIAKHDKRADGFHPAKPQPIKVASEPVGNTEEELMNDIEKSLNQIGDIEEPTEKPLTRRQERRVAAAKPKKRLRKGKIVKRIIIILILLVIGIVGYFGIKALLAGGKMFKGNPLAMLTTKTRLAEDENGRTNVLVFGTSGYSMDENAWDGAMLTDSIMVVSVDQDNNNAYMMSLPRDLYVKHTCPVLGTTAGKLNETFYCGYATNKDEKAGAEALMKQAGEILGLDIQYYVHADWTALVQAVNAVGGVDITIESDDPRGIYDSSTNLRYANGEVAHLDGEKALALARARNHNYGDYGLAGGNYDREKNQQKILAALQQKALSLGTILNPVSVNNLIDSLGNNLITSFDASHVQTLIDLASNVKADQIKQLPFVGRTDDGPDLIGSYTPNGSYAGEAPITSTGPFDYSEIQAYIKKNLSSDPVVLEAAVIDVLNGSETTGLAGEEAEELEKDGYTIGEIANAPELSSAKITIYQRNQDKAGTADALKKKYNVDITKGDLDGYTTDADFIVVIGSAE